MTEGEAKTKWCPFVRVALIDEQLGAVFEGYNRMSYKQSEHMPDGGAYSPETKCIGSECMAWRWNVFTTVTTNKSKPPEHKAVVDNFEIKIQKEFGGYCGLASKP